MPPKKKVVTGTAGREIIHGERIRGAKKPDKLAGPPAWRPSGVISTRIHERDRTPSPPSSPEVRTHRDFLQARSPRSPHSLHSGVNGIHVRRASPFNDPKSVMKPSPPPRALSLLEAQRDTDESYRAAAEAAENSPPGAWSGNLLAAAPVGRRPLAQPLVPLALEPREKPPVTPLEGASRKAGQFPNIQAQREAAAEDLASSPITVRTPSPVGAPLSSTLATTLSPSEVVPSPSAFTSSPVHAVRSPHDAVFDNFTGISIEEASQLLQSVHSDSEPERTGSIPIEAKEHIEVPFISASRGNASSDLSKTPRATPAQFTISRSGRSCSQHDSLDRPETLSSHVLKRTTAVMMLKPTCRDHCRVAAISMVTAIPVSLAGAAFMLYCLGPKDGERGPQGLPGLQGLQGSNGTDGIDGLRGPRGFNGTDGVDGLPGAKGDMGDAGPVGPAGLQGIQGPKGDTGDVGPVGPAGLQGAQGVKGDTGDTGPQGLIGAPGPAGLDANFSSITTNRTHTNYVQSNGEVIALPHPFSVNYDDGDGVCTVRDLSSSCVSTVDFGNTRPLISGLSDYNLSIGEGGGKTIFSGISVFDPEQTFVEVRLRLPASLDSTATTISLVGQRFDSFAADPLLYIFDAGGEDSDSLTAVLRQLEFTAASGATAGDLGELCLSVIDDSDAATTKCIDVELIARRRRLENSIELNLQEAQQNNPSKAIFNSIFISMGLTFINLTTYDCVDMMMRSQSKQRRQIARWITQGLLIGVPLLSTAAYDSFDIDYLSYLTRLIIPFLINAFKTRGESHTRLKNLLALASSAILTVGLTELSNYEEVRHKLLMMAGCCAINSAVTLVYAWVTNPFRSAPQRTAEQARDETALVIAQPMAKAMPQLDARPPSLV